jgi:hypothetical protein
MKNFSIFLKSGSGGPEYKKFSNNVRKAYETGGGGEGEGIFAQKGKANREVEKNRCISLKTNSVLSLFFVLGVNLYNENCYFWLFC